MDQMGRIQPMICEPIALDDARSRERAARREEMRKARQRRKAWADFSAARRAEKQFAIKLRRIAQGIVNMLKARFDGTIQSTHAILQEAARYSAAIAPWAVAVLKKLHADIARRDEKQWDAYAQTMGRTLREEVKRAPVGDTLRRLLSEQAPLIASMPLDAAHRLHERTIANLTSGQRAATLESFIAEELVKAGNYSKAKATLIARTETARTQAALTQARAEHLGSVSYVWRSQRDGRTRPTHKALDGTVQRWDSPPECDPPHRAHAGAIWNCRCYAFPILPD
jgi:SPP1 gp7 family putative phage head morphogenesis protein